MLAANCVYAKEGKGLDPLAHEAVDIAPTSDVAVEDEPARGPKPLKELVDASLERGPPAF